MNFERLATDFAGIKMKTPVMGASGTFGFGIEYKDFLNLGDVGAIISKGLTPLPRSGNNGVRVAETPGGMLNCIGLENPGIDVFLRDILPKVRQEAPDTAFIANFSAGTVEDYGMMAAKLDVDGVDGVEVNISCPNVKEGGIVFGTFNELCKLSSHQKARIFDFVSTLPHFIELEAASKPCVLTHAGLMADFLVENKGKISVLKSLQKALNFDEFEFLISPDIHYMSHAELARLDKYLFVGHVPTFQLDINGQNYIIKNEFYTDLDSGSGYSGGRVCALRLDDMKEFYA